MSWNAFKQDQEPKAGKYLIAYLIGFVVIVTIVLKVMTDGGTIEWQLGNLIP